MIFDCLCLIYCFVLNSIEGVLLWNAVYSRGEFKALKSQRWLYVGGNNLSFNLSSLD